MTWLRLQPRRMAPPLILQVERPIFGIATVRLGVACDHRRLGLSKSSAMRSFMHEHARSRRANAPPVIPSVAHLLARCFQSVVYPSAGAA